MSHRHALELLAADRGYLVQLCRECSIVHVDVGPVTLRLRPGALDSLAQVLTRASHELHRAEANEETVRIELEKLTAPSLVN
ncbi:hypothetical protein PPSIR1_40305 [Plesiocystis pacifica SIR-1]|uniref:Uncharacterized protein n=1 Tax=Plesiocystis pacifica SIR-1 TaxID=391625 RepID=A6FYJ1_9BACT|nr:hypothetical protein [Plesiocystis pacifica]EDM81263.1 hypothetical protein PPSIR1_40305 [Plesiocystis pacifica SIR-1]